MTVAHHLRKAFYVPVVAALLVMLFVVLLGPLTLTCPVAAADERIVVDRHTGLAIGGFDPVAYFVEAEAVLGTGDFEYAVADTVWRFRNEGNRAAFVDNPEVYMPRFGGYDPVAVARDVGVPGNPRLWLIVENRLFLFYSPEARTAFADNSKTIIEAAARNWPAVQTTLSP
jgi:hypothetical protein